MESTTYGRWDRPKTQIVPEIVAHLLNVLRSLTGALSIIE
jgi:hypothetical protein